MRSKLMRKQEEKGIVNKAVSFILFAKVDLTQEERFLVSKYRLSNEVVYNSEALKKNMDAAVASTSRVGQLARLAMAKMSLQVTVYSLTEGQSITCSTLDEVLGAEEAVRDACVALKQYLEVAETFDGREEIFEYETSAGGSVYTTEPLEEKPTIADPASGFLG